MLLVKRWLNTQSKISLITWNVKTANILYGRVLGAKIPYGAEKWHCKMTLRRNISHEEILRQNWTIGQKADGKITHRRLSRELSAEIATNLEDLEQIFSRREM